MGYPHAARFLTGCHERSEHPSSSSHQSGFDRGAPMFTESWDAYGFVVDPAVAKALRDDVRALEDLPKTWQRNGRGAFKDQEDALLARYSDGCAPPAW